MGKAAEIAGVTVLEFKELFAGRGIYRELVAEPTREMDEKLEKLSDQMDFIVDTDVLSMLGKIGRTALFGEIFPESEV